MQDETDGLLGNVAAHSPPWVQLVTYFELFFKWIKQHLRIKAFYGTSENAVKTQIWIAVSIYVLVAIVRKRLGLAASLYQTLQILSVTLFEKTPILGALQTPEADAEFAESVNQLILFDI